MADATTLSVLITARDQASAAFEKIEGNMGRMAAGFQKHRKSIGVAATAIGGLITGIAAMSVKSSLDQQVGIRQLDAAMKQVGTSYASNKQQIEELVAAQQDKTNFGDEEQRKALRELILTSGSYDKAMAAMIPTMELAAGKEMDLSAAATLVARAISGEETALGRYGVAVEKGAGATAVFTAIMAAYGGQAEAAADPTIQLKNRVGDLFQVMGDALVPMMEVLVPLIDKMVVKMIAWAEAHPGLTKVLVIVATAVGGVLLVLGTLLLLLPPLAAGFALVSASILPVTAVVLGVAAAIAAGIIIWKNWETMGLKVKVLLWAFLAPIMAIIAVIKNWDKIWVVLRKTTEVVINAIIKAINIVKDAFIGFVNLIKVALDKVPGVIQQMIPGFENVRQALDNVTDSLQDGIPTIDIYNERQETIKRLGEGLAESAEHWAEVEEAAAERKITAMGNVTGAVSDSVTAFGESLEEQKGLEKEYTNWKAISDRETERLETEAQETSHNNLVEFLRKRLVATNEHLAENYNSWEAGFADVENLEKEHINWKARSDALTLKKEKEANELRLEQNRAYLQKQLLLNNEHLAEGYNATVAAWEKANALWEENEAKRLAGGVLDAPPGAVPPPTVPGAVPAPTVKVPLPPAVKAVIAEAPPSLATAIAAIPASVVTNPAVAAAIKAAAKLPSEAKIPGGAHITEAAVFERHWKQRVEDAIERINTTVAEAMQKETENKEVAAAKAVEVAAAAKGLPERQKRLANSPEVMEALKSGNIYEINKALDEWDANSFAHGGRSPGGLALVGERGPELVSLPRGAFVHPSGTGPGGGVTLIFNGDVYGVDDLREVVVEAVRDHAISGGFAGVFGEP